MNTKLQQPLPNRLIRVCKWCREVTSDGIDYYRDFDEINSNEYNPSFYDGWEYAEDIQ